MCDDVPQGFLCDVVVCAHLDCIVLAPSERLSFAAELAEDGSAAGQDEARFGQVAVEIVTVENVEDAAQEFYGYVAFH